MRRRCATDVLAADRGAPAGDVVAADGSTAVDAAAADDVGTADAPTTDAPTFGQVWESALQGCSGFGPMRCHTRAPFGGGLDLTRDSAWASLVSVASEANPAVPRVRPGDPAASMLVRKLTNQLATDLSEGDPMPRGEGIRWSEPPCVDIVRAWIAAGARND